MYTPLDFAWFLLFCFDFPIFDPELRTEAEPRNSDSERLKGHGLKGQASS